MNEALEALVRLFNEMIPGANQPLTIVHVVSSLQYPCQWAKGAEL